MQRRKYIYKANWISKFVAGTCADKITKQSLKWNLLGSKKIPDIQSVHKYFDGVRCVGTLQSEMIMKYGFHKKLSNLIEIIFNSIH